MSKRRLDAGVIMSAIGQYTDGLKSVSILARELGVSDFAFYWWLRVYEKYGVEYFSNNEINYSYPKELKICAVKEYLSGVASQYEICLKYGISTHTVLQRWIKRHNEGKEFEDYPPAKGTFLMKSRKVSKVEKIEIVEFCINSNYDYKVTADKFVVPYSQVYQWVQKYKNDGATGLDDGRGRQKPIQQPLSEVEQLRVELEETRRKLEYTQIENEILKKKEEIELRQVLQKPDKR